MIPVSNAFKEAMANGQRNWIEEVDITLKSGSVLHLTNADIWGGTLTINDAVSAANTFGAIGSAIINSAKFTMNNIYDDYSPYDFLDANVVIWIGLDLDGTIEKFRKGTYTIDDAQYNGDLISVECVDYMSKFDVPYTKSTLTYPATLEYILRDVCNVCDVTLNTYDFPQKNFQVASRPNAESVTCREIVSWVATIAGCFARCDTLGRLELGWFDQDSLEAEQGNLDGGVFDSGTPVYTTGDAADGGQFNPWNIGYVINSGDFEDLKAFHRIYSVFTHDISTDDVVITGVRASVKVESGDFNQGIKEYTSGSDGYVVELQSTNEFITTANAQSVVNTIGNKIIGLKFRKLNATILSDPTIEAGDVAFFLDSKTRQYFPIVVSESSFTVGNSQKIYSHASTPAKNSAARYSEATKDYVALRKSIEQEKTERERALQQLADRLAATNGLYTTTQSTGSGNIYYMHNHPNLSDSDIIWKMNAEAWGVSTDGGQTWNAGMTVDGDTIVRILTATGINADWINAGQLRISDTNGNETLFADTQTGIVRIAASQLSVTGRTVEQIAYDSIKTGGKNLLRVDPKRYVATDYQAYSLYLTERLVAGVEYTIQFWGVELDANSTGVLVYWGGASNRIIARNLLPDANGYITETFTVTAEQASHAQAANNWLNIYNYPNGHTGMNMSMQKWKLERGNVITDWTIAPEDLSTADDLSEFAQTVTTKWGEIEGDIDDLQRQIDGVVDTYYYNYVPTANNYPANEWTTTQLKEEHEGDLFLDTSTGKSYRWITENNVWQWKEIPDTASAQALQLAQEAKDTADGKRRVFVAQPTNAQAYDVGDLWVNATYGTTYTQDVLRCKTAKTAGSAFSINHWQLASNYTDDTTANSALSLAQTAELHATKQYGICETAAGTATKVVALEGFIGTFTGAKVTVSFINGNTASNPKLQVGATVAKNIVDGSGANLPAKYNWSAYSTVDFVYTGSAWQIINYADSLIQYYDNSTLNQQRVFNKLTNNGTAQGIFLDNGELYINGQYIQASTISADKISGGTLKIGGKNNRNGVLEIYNASNERVGRWDNGALYIGNIVSALTSPNTKISTAGAITTNSLTAKKYVYVDGNKTSLFKIPFGNTDTDYLSLSSSGLNIKYQTCTVSGGRAGDSSGVYSYGLILTNNTSSSTHRRMTLTPSVFYVSETVGSNSYGLSYQKNLFSFSTTGGGFNCNATRLYVSGNLAVTGTKNRQVKTEGYGDRLLYAYETASPLFGDVGEGRISDDGKCYVQIDSIFAETVTLNQYQVFLQKYGDGDCWVSERKVSYFVVEGTAGLSFGWELKAKQSDYTQQRLDRDVEFVPQQNSRDYGEELENHIQEIAKEREVAA